MIAIQKNMHCKNSKKKKKKKIKVRVEFHEIVRYIVKILCLYIDLFSQFTFNESNYLFKFLRFE